MPIKPSLCIINYNGMSTLPVILPSACDIAASFAEIVLIDNASTDDSVKYVQEQFPQVRVVRRADNPGPGAARNTAIQEARSDLILLMDNDVTLTAHCVEELTKALAEHPKACLATPAIIYAHRRDVVQYDGAECHFLGLQTLLDEDKAVSTIDGSVRKIGSMISCCFLLDRSRLPGPEQFDEFFFIYFEDHDFGVRLRALGSEVLSVPQAQCFHGKGTEGLSIRQAGQYTSRRVFFLIRNRWLFILKNFSVRTMVLLVPLMLFYEAAQLLLVIKKGWFSEWLRALQSVAKHLPNVTRERARIQKLRRVPDRELLIGGRLPFRPELSTSAIERFGQNFLNAVVAGYWKLVAPLI